MHRRVRLALVGALVALALAPAAAAPASRPRISVAGIRGTRGSAIGSQLSRALCRKYVCVPPARIRRGGRIDFRQVKRERIAGILSGAVSRTKGRASVSLALLTASLRPERTWVIPLDRQGRIPKGSLESFAGDLRRELGGSSIAPTPATPHESDVAPQPPREPSPAVLEVPPVAISVPPARPEPAPASPEPTPAPPAPPEPARPDPAAASIARTAPDGPGEQRRRYTSRPSEAVGAPASTARALRASPTRARRTRGSVDLGVHLAKRELSYDNAGSAGLKTFEGNVASPYARIELYPLALATDRWPAAFSLFAAYGRSFGFETEQANVPGTRHETVFEQIEAGAGWRILPAASSRLSFTPRASYRMLSLKVKPAAGVSIDGLPDANLAGPSFGLDVEIPVGRRFGLLVGAAYTRWTTAKDLVGGDGAFFPDGSASAIDGALGISADAGPLTLRLVGEYSATRYELEGAGAYVAEGAKDTYLGARAAARLRF